jgi:hypothetical protein
MPMVLTPHTLKLVKVAATGLSAGIGSSHLSEAIAAGFGYRTNSSLQAVLEHGPVTVELSDAEFRDRLSSLGPYHCQEDMLSAALREATMRRIRKVADQYPRMTLNGLNPSIGSHGVYKTLADWETSRADFFSSDAVDMFLKSELWLAQCRKGPNIYRGQSSYGMKHSVEAWLKQNHPSVHHYVANGAFIAAAVSNGFEVEEIGGSSLNCLINVAATPSRYPGIIELCDRKNAYEILAAPILTLLCEIIRGWQENRKAKRTLETASFFVNRGLRRIQRDVAGRVRVSGHEWSVLLTIDGDLAPPGVRNAILRGKLGQLLLWHSGRFPYAHVPWAKPVNDREGPVFSDEQPGW